MKTSQRMILFVFFLLPHVCTNAYEMLMISGENSGDKLGAWYLQKLKKEKNDVSCTAIGGDNIERAG